MSNSGTLGSLTTRAALIYNAGTWVHLAFTASVRNAVISSITIAPNLQLIVRTRVGVNQRWAGATDEEKALSPRAWG